MIIYKYESEVLIIAIKTIAFRVDEDFHTKVKIQATKERKTLQEYVIEVLKEDIKAKAKDEQQK